MWLNSKRERTPFHFPSRLQISLDIEAVYASQRSYHKCELHIPELCLTSFPTSREWEAQQRMRMEKGKKTLCQGRGPLAADDPCRLQTMHEPSTKAQMAPEENGSNESHTPFAEWIGPLRICARDSGCDQQATLGHSSGNSVLTRAPWCKFK